MEAGTGAGRRGEAESWRGEEEEGVEKKLMFFVCNKKEPAGNFPSDSFEFRPGTKVGEVILIRLDRDRSIGERWRRNGLNYFRCSCFHACVASICDTCLK